MKWFEGRKIIIATKHQKEKVLEPLLNEELGLVGFTPSNYDTDKFGTFSGEVNRSKNAYDTLKQKCLEAMNLYNYDLGIASEGSFGPHPTLFFASADDELLVFIDKKNGLEIFAREISLETNFNASGISSTDELIDFAEKVQFPSHGLILKDKENNFHRIVKDIESTEDLISNFISLKSQFGSVYAETDMRAHRNPTRMKVIQKAAEKLIAKIKSSCPECQTPGFDVKEIIKGLPCEWCKAPTESTLAFRYECKTCNHIHTKQYPNGKNYESPEYCHNCNP